MLQIIAGKMNAGTVKLLLGILLIIANMSIDGESGKTLKEFFGSLEFFTEFYKMPYNDVVIVILVALGVDDLLKHRR